LTGLPVDTTTVTKVKETVPLKTVEYRDEKRELLNGNFDISDNTLQDKNVLVLDDVFDTGETLNAVTDVIKNKGKAKSVSVLTVTKTRT
jgi:predicted amidophosphoribosyltransferase